MIPLDLWHGSRLPRLFWPPHYFSSATRWGNLNTVEITQSIVIDWYDLCQLPTRIHTRSKWISMDVKEGMESYVAHIFISIINRYDDFTSLMITPSKSILCMMTHSNVNKDVSAGLLLRPRIQFNATLIREQVD